MKQHKANPVSQPLAEVPGIGPVLANKMARVVWAMMATGEAYRGSRQVAAPAAGAAATA